MLSGPQDGGPDSAPAPARAAASLFERLAAAEAGSMSRRSDRNAVIASVVRNLHLNLNSHAGAVPIRPDWGLPDFRNLALRMQESAPLLAQEIKRQIDEFEPRLRQVTVRYRPQRERFMIACFDIEAKLVLAESRPTVRFEVLVHPNGAVRVH